MSVTGARESDINLAVVLRLRDLLAFYGTDPVLLRETDVSLHSPGAVSPREKKTSDLKNRTEAVNHIPNATLLSIHQNSYPEGKYWGSQAFYAKTEGSQELAQALQTAPAGGLAAEQPPGVQERARHRLPDEPCELPGGAAGVRFPYQPRGGGPPAGRGLSKEAGGSDGSGVADTYFVTDLCRSFLLPADNSVFSLDFFTVS